MPFSKLEPASSDRWEGIALKSTFLRDHSYWAHYITIALTLYHQSSITEIPSPNLYTLPIQSPHSFLVHNLVVHLSLIVVIVYPFTSGITAYIKLIKHFAKHGALQIRRMGYRQFYFTAKICPRKQENLHTNPSRNLKGIS